MTIKRSFTRLTIAALAASALAAGPADAAPTADRPSDIGSQSTGIGAGRADTTTATLDRKSGGGETSGVIY